MDQLWVLSVSLAFLGCLVASYLDLKTGRVPNKVPALLLASSILLASASFLSGDASYPWTYLCGFFLGFALGFILWGVKAWSGGDAKMFWAISALLPEGLFALNVLINLAVLLGIRLLVSRSMRKKTPVVLMPYMTLALVASFFMDWAGLFFPG